jgi:hypothetical protein
MTRFGSVHITLIFFALFSIGLNAQDIAINEIMASNSTTVTDEDGDFEDWIELYNYGQTEVNLENFGLSDNFSNRYKWIFPSIVIQPKEHLLVFASGKDRKVIPLSEQVILPMGSNWSYLDDGTNQGDAWRLANFDDTNWQNGEAPLGYHTGNNGTFATTINYGDDIQNKHITYYFRKTFEIESSTFREIFVKLRYDDGAIVYLNGNEIGRRNLADEEISYQTLALKGFDGYDESVWRIDWSLLVEGTNTLAVEIHQATLGSSDIYFDLQLWSKQQHPHTNFKIAAEGEPVFLTSPSNEIINSVPAKRIPSDISYGRNTDGTGDFAFFSTPTPNSPNHLISYNEILAPVHFSTLGGVYTSEFSLSLSHPDPDVTIIYTTDGSVPDINNQNGTTYFYKDYYPNLREENPSDSLWHTYQSFVYNNEIMVTDKSAEADKISQIKTSIIHPFLPETPVRKGFVIQAKAFKEGALASQTSSNTYFIWSEGNPYKVPIVSLQIQEDYLFDYNKGVYTPGADWDEALALDEEANPCTYGNYMRKTEYPARVEIFDTLQANAIINQGVGFRIHGNCGRLRPIKTYRLYARSRYDDAEEFNYNFFDSQVTSATNPENTLYKRLLFRFATSGGSQIVDIATQKIMESVYPGLMRTRHAVNFINGEFWGITSIRDRFDQYHVGYHYNLDPENIIIYSGLGEVAEGIEEDKILFENLYNYIVNNDLQNEQKLLTVKSMLDIENFIDMYIMNIYFGKWDWYGFDHFSFWRVRNIENNHFGDGKFRTFTWDFDVATSLGSEHNMLHEALNTFNPKFTAMITSLLRNNAVKNQFINRFADHINTTFVPERIATIVQTEAAAFAPYLEEHHHRWKLTYPGPEDINEQYIQYGYDRPAHQRQHIIDEFGLNGSFAITIDINNPESGFVSINTININGNTPGVTDNPYPWSGTYFQNIPIKITANAREGYKFSHWTGISTSTNRTITISPNADCNLTAHFIPTTNDKELLYFWLMDNNLPNDYPLESMYATYNYESDAASIEFTSCIEGYPLVATNSLWRKASMERRNAPTNVNYRPEANDNKAYGTFTMRALQIKQPFEKDNRKNTLSFRIPTNNYKDIHISFAAQDQGASTGMFIEYWDYNSLKWKNADLQETYLPLSNDYQRYDIDCSDISIANDNPDFQLRVRFDGANMDIDTGKRIVFGNVAVEGKRIFSTHIPQQKNAVIVFPNPTKDIIYIKSTSEIKEILLFNTMGMLLPMPQFHYGSEQISFSLEHLPQGTYIVWVKTSNDESPYKIIKN